MEQIEASIARYVLLSAGEPVTPYYNDLKEGFKVPAVYFPEKEVDNAPEDLDSYVLNNAWFIKFFHSTTGAASELAKRVLKRIVGNRYLIPVVDENGVETGRGIRISRVEIKKLDDGVYQMWLDWKETYSYDDMAIKHTKMQNYEISYKKKEKEM